MGMCLKDSFPLRGLRHISHTHHCTFSSGLKDSFPLRGLRLSKNLKQVIILIKSERFFPA